MEKLVYVDRRNTNCNKWDGQQKMFGEEGLHAMWVADMDFRVPECVVSNCKYTGILSVFRRSKEQSQKFNLFRS